MEKKYYHEYEDYEDGKTAETMVGEILADPEFQNIDKLIIGDWGGAYEDSCQAVLDAIADNADKFSHITSLFVGDMDYEECEISWIMQGDYSRIWEAMPQLKEITVKGSTDLKLGKIKHSSLESLTIICGGLGSDVIKEIEEAELPELKKLLVYIGSDNYGFDGDADTVRSLLANSDFPKLEYLGIADSEIQDELTAVVLDCKYIDSITTLDLSCGTITDKGGELLLKKLPELKNLKKLDLSYNYLSDEMKDKLTAAAPGVEMDLSDSQEAEEWDGELWLNAMVTE
ncbi:MAG: STM4015 family protein [Oscillospiraceae bacterium]|nr:STM4015 family protein [Oscillospiraceae bacterium]